MLRFIYTTDLHGAAHKFEQCMAYTEKLGVKLLHIGGDILPKGSHIMEEQKKFVNGYLKKFYTRCKEKGITVLSFFGNDDLYTRKKYFRKYGVLLDEQPHTQDGYEFTAYQYVPDYPFNLKTACKKDSSSWVMTESQFGNPVDVGPNGFEPIQDLKKYFKDKGTIEDDLKRLKGGNKAIVAMHCPPQGFDLDVCYGGRRVGSRSITEWVKREKPLLLLCGHIHENYQVTGTWKAISGNTTVIQPGQMESETSMVYIEINGPSVSANLITI